MAHVLLSPGLDRAGRPSALKITTLTLLLVPAALLATRFVAGELGPRPLAELNHLTGLWTVRLLFVTLAITPLRNMLRWPTLIQVRRMVGVATALYAIVHLVTFIADQAFNVDRVIEEILLRTYLTIGFAGLVGLILLLATSTDGTLRRLGGKRWRLLHRLVYVIGGLGVVHFVWQSKLDVTQPTVMAGLFVWLMAYRLLDAWVGMRGRLPLWAIATLPPFVGLATAIAEALYFWLRNGVELLRVLAANLSLDAGLRPAWVVLAIVGGLTLVALIRRERTLARRGPATPARAVEPA